MKNYGPFLAYTPTIPTLDENATDDENTSATLLKSLLEKGVAFAKTDDGDDWYSVQANFSADTIKIAYDNSGLIWQFSTDVSRLWPKGYSVAEVDASVVPDDLTPDGTWMYSGGKIIARVYTSDELISQAEKVRTNLLSEAMSTISLWQTELSLGTISDDDKAMLVEWLAYIKAVKAVNTSMAPLIDWPSEPVNA